MFVSRWCGVPKEWWAIDRIKQLLFLAPIVAASVLAGCSARLVDAPNLYAPDDHPYTWSDDDARAFAGADVIYATDREPNERHRDPADAYGFGRSVSLAIGVARVEFGRGTTWERLVQHSVGARDASLDLGVASVDEHFRFPPSAAFAQDEMDVADRVESARDDLEQLVESMLDANGGTDAYVYVHGFNNGFEDGLFAIGQIWHYLGRRGVPISYSWPAGRGTLRGYAYDRESGEFTNFHLKQFLRALGDVDRIERIHLISHSRGTDVLMTSLRELAIEARCEGRRLSETLKLGHLVLAAPDLDVDVVSQRIGAEQLHLEAETTTVYMNADDKALGLSKVLFLGRTRFGRAREEDFSPEQARFFERSRDQLALIDSRTSTSFIGHSYFYANPAVLSDLVLLLAEDAWVDDPRRPLEPTDYGAWIIRDGYPY